MTDNAAIEIVGPFNSPQNPHRPYVRCRVGWGWEVKQQNGPTYGPYPSQQKAIEAAMRIEAQQGNE